MEIAAFIISLTALGIAGLTALYVRRQADAAAEAASHEGRAADAAQEAVSYQRDEVEQGRVDFRFEHVDRHRYVLHNAGTHSAYDVTVDTGDLNDDPVATFEEFSARHREPYLIQRTVDSTTTYVVVSWHYHPSSSDPPQVTRLFVE